MADIQKELFDNAYRACNRNNIEQVKDVLNNPDFKLEAISEEDGYNLLHAAQGSEEIFDLLLAQEKLDINVSNPLETILERTADALDSYRFRDSFPQQAVYNNLLKLTEDKRFQFKGDKASKRLIKLLSFSQRQIKSTHLDSEMRQVFQEKVKAFRYGLMSEEEAAKTLNIHAMAELEFTKKGEKKTMMQAEYDKLEQQIIAEEEKNTVEYQKRKDIPERDKEHLMSFYTRAGEELYDTQRKLAFAIGKFEEKTEPFAKDLKTLETLEKVAENCWKQNPIHWERLGELKELLPDSDIKQMFSLNNKPEYSWMLPVDMKDSHLEIALDYMALNDEQYAAFKKFEKDEQQMLLQDTIKAYEGNVSPAESLFIISKGNNFDFDKPSPYRKQLSGEESTLNDLYTIIGSISKPNYKSLELVLKNVTKMDSEQLLKTLEFNSKEKAYDKLLAEIVLHPAFDRSKLSAYHVEVLKRDERTAAIAEALKPDVNADKGGINIALMQAKNAGDMNAFKALLKNPELNLFSHFDVDFAPHIFNAIKGTEFQERSSFGSYRRDGYKNEGFTVELKNEILARRKALTKDAIVFDTEAAQKIPEEYRERILQLPPFFQSLIKHNDLPKNEYVSIFEAATEMAQQYGKEASFSFPVFNETSLSQWYPVEKNKMMYRLENLSAEETKKNLPLTQANLENRLLIADYATALIEHQHLTGELVTEKEKKEKLQDIEMERLMDIEHAYLVKKDGTVKIYERNPEDVKNDVLAHKIAMMRKLQK